MTIKSLYDSLNVRKDWKEDWTETTRDDWRVDWSTVVSSLFFDTFTGSAGTLLENHSPDNGGAYSYPPAESGWSDGTPFTIDGSGNMYVAWDGVTKYGSGAIILGDVDTADCEVIINFSILPNSRDFGFYIPLRNSTDFNAVFVEVDLMFSVVGETISADLDLFDSNGYSDSLMSVATDISRTDHIAIISCSGSTITVKLDGVTIGTATTTVLGSGPLLFSSYQTAGTTDDTSVSISSIRVNAL